MNAAESTRRSGALPIEYSSFVDRRAALAAARTELGGTRLLTILGAGGVGKTRFAIRLAQSVRRFYQDGCWFVDLSSVSRTGSVVDEVGRILGASGMGDPVEAITRFFGAKRGLLVLDNCEQVIDQCAELVPLVLAACPELTVIATSRELLRVSSETVFQVEPLGAVDSRSDASSPAVMLFLERCAAALPDPTPAELHAIEEICRRLDGLPLAIELAASRVRLLAPEQLLDRLREPLTLLTGGARDAPDRQQTIRSAIAWSYELCTDVERALWRRMSVFTGGWDLDSAEWMSAAASHDELTLDVVQSLLDKSIIARRPRNGIVYYDMLDTVRQFGIEASTPAELDDARAALRDWYLDRLAHLDAEWYGPNQAYWLAMTRTELPNIRVALEYCISTRDADRGARMLVSGWRVVWQAHGRVDEMGRWGMRVLGLADPSTPEGCQLITMMGTLEYARGNPEAGAPLLAKAEELAEALDDDYCRGFILDERGSILRDADTPAMYAAALELHGGSNPLPARRNLVERIVLMEDSIGNHDVALRRREALIARAVRAGESYETSFLLLNSGMIAARRGAVDDAVTLLRQSLSLAQNLEDPFGLAVVEEALARVATDTGDHVRAATLLGLTDMIGGASGAVSAAFPGVGEFRAGVEQSAREGMGRSAFDAAYADGRAMTEADGVAYALGARIGSPRGGATQDSATSVLSPRESQVAALVGQGLTDREIADRLVISRRTAEGHVANGLMKLGFSSRAQLAAWTAQGRGDGG